ncbi:abc transporter [Pelomyxa schiedti]|nr:abc transporter [Pelomyxa schiedti]
MSKKALGEAIVKLVHVSKSYSIAGRKDGVQALKDIHMDDDSPFQPIRKGEFVILRGPSGGGKTTLLNLIGTLDTASAGTVNLLGRDLAADSKDSELSALRLTKIGFVFQTFNLLATMSAYENVELPMTILGKLSASERRARTLELLELVGLQDRMGHLPSELSGGEQQRVTIARALANKPELLLLDEPTGDLDTKNTIEVMDLLLNLNNELGTTCVMVTHNPDVECYADRIIYINDGRIVKQAVNVVQSPLIMSDYMAYLSSLERPGGKPTTTQHS